MFINDFFFQLETIYYYSYPAITAVLRVKIMKTHFN